MSKYVVFRQDLNVDCFLTTIPTERTETAYRAALIFGKREDAIEFTQHEADNIIQAFELLEFRWLEKRLVN